MAAITTPNKNNGGCVISNFSNTQNRKKNKLNVIFIFRPFFYSIQFDFINLTTNIGFGGYKILSLFSH